MSLVGLRVCTQNISTAREKLAQIYLQYLHVFPSLIVPGIIVDEEVEEEVEGRSKWTDRNLMLQSGLLTAVEVEECEDGSFIRRIRAR